MRGRYSSGSSLRKIRVSSSAIVSDSRRISAMVRVPLATPRRVMGPPSGVDATTKSGVDGLRSRVAPRMWRMAMDWNVTAAPTATPAEGT